MPIRKLFDISNYQGEPPREFFQKLRDAGYDAMIPGAQVPAYTAYQIREAEAVGIEVPAVYQMQYWNDGDAGRLEQAFQFGRPVWVDCETPRGFKSVEQIVDRIQWAKDRCLERGQYAGIYTGDWWWKPNTANSWQFKDDPLWVANYLEREPAHDFHEFEAAWFGGWARPTVWQWTSKGAVYLGLPRDADLNLWNAPEPPPPAKRVPTAEEVAWACIHASHLYRLEELPKLHAYDRETLRLLAEIVSQSS